MAVTITRTAWTDDDGTGTTGTVLNNAAKTALYNEIDAALASLFPAAGGGTIGGQIAFSDTMDASSSITGAVKTAGGLGVAKKLYVGTDLNVAANIIGAGTTDASSSITGAVITAGGLGVAKKLYVGTDLNVLANAIFAGTTDATSSTAGAVTIAGGVAVAKKLFVGTLLDLSTAAAGQVKFPGTQNASSDVNTLDDYEEGTFTPVLGGSGGTSGQTYAGRYGRYIKIGKLVFATCFVSFSNKGTITGSVQLQGLPFTAENNDGNEIIPVFGGSYWNALGTAMVSVGGYLSPNTSFIQLQGITGALTTSANMTTTDITNSTALMLTVVYPAAA